MVRSLAVALIAMAGLACWVHVLSRDGEVAEACGAYGPYDFNTLELADHVNEYKLAINLLAEGKVFPAPLESAGETVDVTYQGLEAGDRLTRTGGTVVPSTAFRIPPTIYYSIAWIEANWANGASAVPWGGVGPVIRSFDCGYGIGQITSGMANTTGTPSSKQALIGTHFLFNIAEGMRILADKWNQAPELRPIAGTGDPLALEDWYYAIWSYNGFAFVNHPFNPDRDPLRAGAATSPLYHCYDTNAESYIAVDDSLTPMFAYSDYTYPEKVYGCMRNPPQRDDVQMWSPVTFNMPDFDRPEVAVAFDPQHFIDCDGHLLGCPGMDFPTSVADDPLTLDKNEAVPTNPDPVPPADAAMAARFVGAPMLTFAGPSSVSLEARATGVIDQATVTATNTGSFIGPFRIRSTAPWLVVRGPGDTAARTLDGAIAVGETTTVVIKSEPLQTSNGHVQQLVVTLDPMVMPFGTPQTATVFFEPLFGGGATFSVNVSAMNNYVAPTPTPTPIPIPTDTPRGDFRQYTPGLSAYP